MSRTSRTGRIVAGSLVAGLVAALALVAVPFAGAPENAISGAVLLAFAAGWALLALLSTAYTDQPHHWALVPAGVLALLGGGLLAWPGAVVDEAAAWVWPPLLLALAAWMASRARRELRSRARPWLLYPVCGALAVAATAGAWETAHERSDRAAYPAPGTLVDVGGYRLHLNCAGSGSPTVVLLPGAGEVSTMWEWIAPIVARDSRVCRYDRAGRAWSEDGPGPQDGVALAADLRTLLARAGVPAPYVLAGHSFGGLYALDYAERYPGDVAGMVLLDATSPEMFARAPAYPRFYEGYRRVSALFPSLARLGVGRLAYRAAFDSLPPLARRQALAFWSTARLARSQRDEWAAAPAVMREAHALTTLGGRPLLVITAARGAQAGWLPMQDDLARLSTNSVHRVMPNATHASLVEGHAGAALTSGAIAEVVSAVRSGRGLARP